MFLILFMLLVCINAMASVVLLALAAASLFDHRWGNGIRALPAIAWLVLLVPFTAIAGDYVHFLLMAPYYAWTILHTPGWDRKPIEFVWGDAAMFVTDGLQVRTLVFDLSGTTGKLVDHVLPAAEKGLGVSTTHFLGPFYMRCDCM